MNIDSRSVIGFGSVALAFGLAIAAFVYARSDRAPVLPIATPSKVEPAPVAATVVVASKNIGRGERIAPEMLSSLRISQPRPAEAFAQPNEIVGGIALDNVRAGQILIRSGVMRNEAARPGLSVLVPPGLRAVALRVNDEIAVGNFIRADDKVDIELVIPADKLAKIRGESVTGAERPESRTLLQDIKVLSVGEALTTAQDNHAIRMQNLTVAVTPRDALIIALGKQIGTFYLALRHPSDDQEGGAGWTKVDDILSGTPRSTKAGGDRAAASDPLHRVIIIEGSKEGHQSVP